MRWLGIAVVLGVLGARWGMVTMDDTTLRDDVLFLELLTGGTRAGIDAAVIAQQVEFATKQRQCELVPGSLEVDVKDARWGHLEVQGAGMSVQGKGNANIQDIDIQFNCRRPGVFFAKTAAKFRLRTQAPGDGKANHWPRPEGEEAAATPP